MDKFKKLLKEAIRLQNKINRQTNSAKKLAMEYYELNPLLKVIGEISVDAYREAKKRK